MRIEGSYRFAAPPERVWRALEDPETLAATLPGVRRLEVIGPDRYTIGVAVGVGAVRGSFDGTFAVVDKREPRACVLRGSVRGSAGSAEAQASVRLDGGQDGGTLLSYEGDATVTGPLAGVGQRMVAAAARQNAERFLTAVDRALTAPDGAEAAAGEPAPGRVFAGPAPAPGPAGLRWYVAGLLTGAAVALAGVAVGRWAGRR
jgi:uncharacterized protein